MYEKYITLVNIITHADIKSNIFCEKNVKSFGYIFFLIKTKRITAEN